MAKAFFIVGVLISAVVLLLFRYEYSSQAGLRTDRITGRVELLCGDRWATLDECAGPLVKRVAEPRSGAPALVPQVVPVIKKSTEELAGDIGNKLRCDSLMEKKSKGIQFHLDDDESVPPWARELFLPEWCKERLKTQP